MGNPYRVKDVIHAYLRLKPEVIVGELLRSSIWQFEASHKKSLDRINLHNTGDIFLTNFNNNVTPSGF